jgi:multidrug efflux pump
MALTYDRETMSRLGINVEAANSLLNNAFGQREISTIYQPMNQYKVVMEVDPRYTQDISALDKMFVINNDGKAIPLSYFASWQPANAPLSVNHQGCRRRRPSPLTCPPVRRFPKPATQSTAR